MSFVAVAIGGAALIGGAASLIGSSNQASAANNATGVQEQEFQQQEADQAPYRQAGYGALSELSGMAGTTPSFTQQDFLNNQDPAYGFDLSQGQQAIERSAAASGGLASGGTLKSLTTYAQGQASNEYQNAYNRYMNNQNTQFNRLASVAGLGQTANGQLNEAGTAMAGQVGNNMMGAANAGAAGTVGVANAVSGGVSGIGNTLYQQQLLSQLGTNNYGNFLNSIPSGGNLSSLGQPGSGVGPTGNAAGIYTGQAEAPI